MNAARNIAESTPITERFPTRIHIRTTPQADIWKVTLADGRVGALKIYHGTVPGDERAGIAALSAWRGRGGVDVLDADLDHGWVLTAWLDEPAAIDLVRDGRDDAASRCLAHAARALHQHRAPVSAESKPFAQIMLHLLNLRFAPGCAPGLRTRIETARAIYRTTPVPSDAMRLLHGDLHHGNVILTESGLCAIDPKGFVGPLGFELAGALRAPRGYNHILLDRAKLSDRVTCWSAALGVSERELLGWGVVQRARTIAWRARGTLESDEEAELLGFLIAEWRKAA